MMAERRGVGDGRMPQAGMMADARASQARFLPLRPRIPRGDFNQRDLRAPRA